MTLALAFLLLVLTVPVAGGRLSRLEHLKLRWMWLAVAAVVVQVLILAVVPGGDTGWHRALHLATYALAGACVIANLRQVRFLWVVALGGVLNLIAIAANDGVMPASRSALETAGLDERDGSFTNSDAVTDANLAFLGDVFAIPASWPASNVFSVGDVVMLVGAFLLLHAATGSRLFGGRRTERLPAQGSPAAR